MFAGMTRRVYYIWR